MTLGAGAPFRVASTLRIHSASRPGTRVRTRLPPALLSISMVLSGCALQPSVPDASSSGVDTSATSGDTSAGAAEGNLDSSPASETVSNADPAVTIGIRSPARRAPAELATSGGDSGTSAAQPGSGKDPARDRDTWTRIRVGLSLPHPAHPRVMRAIDWYGRNPEYLRRVTQRARPYLAYIVREVERRGLPMEFALLPVVESAFQVFARSPAGAAGLWQFMPSTGRRYGLRQNRWYDGRRDVVASTRAALDYLTKLLDDFDGDRLLSVAAYNWGEGNIRRAISRNRAQGRPVDVWSLRLPRETRVHVSRLLAIAAVVEDPDRHGVVLEPVPDRVHFQEVPLRGPIDLGVAAGFAGITLNEIRRLNPGFKREVTGPDGPHRLQLPSHVVERFSAKLAALPARNPMRWPRYRIARGDTLSAIAGRYGTSVPVLKQLNGLASDRIRAGRDLILPPLSGTFDTSRLDSATRADPGAAGGLVKTIHRVRAGDSLWAIARRHGVDMRQLAAWNGLTTNTVLRPGRRLALYPRNTISPRPAPPKPAAESFKDSPPAIIPSAVIHVVEQGDTLSAIAKRHGTTVLKLAEFNRIHESIILQPGQELRVIPAVCSKPAPGGCERIRYRVKRGDSLWGISRRFGVSVASLRKWNRLRKDELLVPDRELDVRLTPAPAI